MPTEIDSSEDERIDDDIFSREEAGRLVAASLNTDMDEPEPLVRLLLILFDNTAEPRLRDALHTLMKAAYDQSIVHSIDLDEYLEDLRQGGDPLKDARDRWQESQS